MRPVRLTMQAFGPYPGRQVVDFREAIEAGLFGLYGPTGAGKSSIFSAMTFALFGEPAKGEQDAPSLRCDRAPAETPTEVELVFDIGGRRYVARRSPEQGRPKLRGGGETRMAHEAFLFDATSLAPEEIDRERCGKVIAEKKVREVDAAIVDLLGYRADQFRQIVLLPQGRFEAFLAAKTKERLEILRDLFDVSAYRALTEHLKRQASAAEERVRNERAVCAGRLAAERFESPEALKAGIEEATAARAPLVKAEKAARGATEAARAELQQAEALSAQFDAAGEAEEVLRTLRTASAQMTALEAQVEAADRARPLLALEARMVETEGGVRDAEYTLQERIGAVQKADARAREAADALAVETAREDQVEALKTRIGDLDRHAKALDDARGLVAGLAEARDDERKASEAHTAAAEALAELRERVKRETQALDTARRVEEQRLRLNAERRDLTAALAAARTYDAALEAVRKAEGAVTARMTEREKRAGEAQTARAAYGDAEAALSRVQALHLAAKLIDGAPCPVCGGHEHPSPATGEAANAGLDEAFRKARASRESAEAAERKAQTAVETAKGILGERRARLRDLTAPDRAVEALETAMEVNGDALKDLAASVDLNDAESVLAALQTQAEDDAKTAEELLQTRTDFSTQVQVAQSRLDTMLREVPEALRDPEVLARERASVAGTLGTREQARKDAEAAARKAGDAALEARKEREAADGALTKCREEQGKASEAFRAALDRAALTAEAFVALKPAIDTIAEDRERVSAHAVALRVAEQAATSTAAAIAGRARPDLALAGAAVTAAETTFETASAARSRHDQETERLAKLRDDLDETFRRLDEEEQASGPLRDLSRLCAGENEQKLDLETFAIGAMFDRVLEATNLRYGPMTQHRYRLERDQEGSGRGRRGLGTAVFDSHTGKTRSTTTLSGGESFIAALALALGLADVVESASGKVRLDAVFIDEGFGSLDTENGAGTLDRVLTVLRGLTMENRAIGLISHVPLVQEAIPNGFYVHKSPEGSRVETRGIA